ncbi:hypothetical protein J1G36_20245 [Pseudomonas carnis]|uniref:hypothetical protein n=1 Tax=Pseudomonas carnis TaxID=2487355 RepID=UPI001CA738E6|nr:hypothetical protein [Pseudomonas carnis]MBY8954227.1 hypothetical protein [Pseudomonas carnis]
MLLRTLEIPDAHGQLLNAVVLCGFTATGLHRQFLVYSLNEKSGDELVKIYLTYLEGEDQTLRMCDAPPETLTAAAQVLKDVLRDACATVPRQTEDTYALMDLTDTDIECSAVNTHYSLKISDAWLMNLLHYDPPSEASTLPLQSQDTSSCAPLAIRETSSVTVESVATCNVQTTSSKIDANIKSLVTSITHHKEILLGKYVKLDELQRELEQREQQLLIREQALNQREDELLASISSLQAAEEQLDALLDR